MKCTKSSLYDTILTFFTNFRAQATFLLLQLLLSGNSCLFLLILIGWRGCFLFIFGYNWAFACCNLLQSWEFLAQVTESAIFFKLANARDTAKTDGTRRWRILRRRIWTRTTAHATVVRAVFYVTIAALRLTCATNNWLWRTAMPSFLFLYYLK